MTNPQPADNSEQTFAEAYWNLYRREPFNDGFVDTIKSYAMRDGWELRDVQVYGLEIEIASLKSRLAQAETDRDAYAASVDWLRVDGLQDQLKSEIESLKAELEIAKGTAVRLLDLMHPNLKVQCNLPYIINQIECAWVSTKDHLTKESTDLKAKLKVAREALEWCRMNSDPRKEIIPGRTAQLALSAIDEKGNV